MMYQASFSDQTMTLLRYWPSPQNDLPTVMYKTAVLPLTQLYLHQWQLHMQNFTTKIVNMMRAEGLYASQGAPIILSQVETVISLILKFIFIHFTLNNETYAD